MNQKKQRKFEELKTKAKQVILELDLLKGNGTTIHKRNTLRGHILGCIRSIERTDEHEVIMGSHEYTLYYTLDGLEERITRAEGWLKERRRCHTKDLNFAPFQCLVRYIGMV